MPSTLRVTLKFSFTLSTVLNNWARPSKAKNSHCKGTNTVLEAVNAFMVINPNEGGQSINIKSNLYIKFFLCFKSLFVLS